MGILGGRLGSNGGAWQLMFRAVWVYGWGEGFVGPLGFFVFCLCFILDCEVPVKLELGGGMNVSKAARNVARERKKYDKYGIDGLQYFKITDQRTIYFYHVQSCSFG